MTGIALGVREMDGDVPAMVSQRGRDAARACFPARAAGLDWPAAHLGREEILARISQPAVTAPGRAGKRRMRGAGLLLDWLQDQPGGSWQQRWLACGADAAGKSWRELPARWMREHGAFAANRHALLTAALPALIAADIMRPSLDWFLSRAAASSPLSALMAQVRDPDGFARLRALCEHDPEITEMTAGLVIYRTAVITAVKGGTVADITAGDVLELLDAEKTAAGHGTGSSAHYRLLRRLGIFGTQAPATLRELGTAGQRTPAGLIDRYHITCRPIRDLLVDYLRERQPALDYNSLVSLSIVLGKLFWADLEQHHPGIASLHLPAEVASAWKTRLQTVTRTIRGPGGEKITTEVPRINYLECLTPVRAFYLDLACWAAEEPARWGPWAAPCPVRSEEISRTKHKRRRKSRMDARTRERLPVLPVLIRTAGQRRHDTAARLETARRTPAGGSFTAAGQTLIRSVTTRATSRVWADDPADGGRRDLIREEDRAFWTWAAAETLQATGVRIEELLELTHHSLVQYRLPGTGEVVPLLQIAPSKTDAERLLLVSPGLADVLSTIICRVRDSSGKVPLITGYDRHERRWSDPAPFLFQHDVHGENRVLTDCGVRELLNAALAGTGLTDQQTGGPLQYTPHDFRRIFITDAILGGLPPHIAQVIAGHRDINVTLGYKAIYPQEAIQAHLAFLTRRRALRPTEEYRVPTDSEWDEFLGHFERRKVSAGTCGRAFSTPCIHEHACIRCPMLWPDPAQHARLTEIRDNLTARIAEAEREGWLGEVEGLKISLAGAHDKLAQINQRPGTGTINIGFPAAAPALQPT